MERKQYIKPSVLQLEFRADTEVVTMSTCKGTLNQDGRSLGGTGTCADSACTSPGS